MPRMTTAEAVIETLLARGIDTLFALPGVHNDHLFDAARKASGRIQAEQYGNRLIASNLTNPDFVKFAGSFGMPAFRATSADGLEEALRNALALNAPALVHMPVGEMPARGI